MKKMKKKWTTNLKEINDGWYRILYNGPDSDNNISAIVIVDKCISICKYVETDHTMHKCIPCRDSVLDLLNWGYKFYPMEEKEVFVEVI